MKQQLNDRSWSGNNNKDIASLCFLSVLQKHQTVSVWTHIQAHSCQIYIYICSKISHTQNCVEFCILDKSQPKGKHQPLVKVAEPP